MANTFTEKAVRFLPILDEVYQKEAVTAVLDDPLLTAHAMEGNKIMLPRVSVDGAATYDRDAGYAQGGVTVSYEEYTLKYDRGRKFRIDVVDNDEAAFDLYRQVALQYVRTKEIPELDALRFASIYSAVSAAGSLGVKVQADLEDDTRALALFDKAEQELNEREVPEEGRVLFCSHEFYALLKNDPSILRRMDVVQNTGGLDRRVELLDGMVPVFRVPSLRFVSAVTLKDGVSTGEKEGGYAPAAGSYALNFVYADKAALCGVVKRRVSKIVTPAENQQADAYDVFYRVHHDLIVPANRAAGIYVHARATART